MQQNECGEGQVRWAAGGEQGLGEERAFQVRLPKAKGACGGNVKQEPRTLMTLCPSDKCQAERGRCRCPSGCQSCC